MLCHSRPQSGEVRLCLASRRFLRDHDSSADSTPSLPTQALQIGDSSGPQTLLGEDPDFDLCLIDPTSVSRRVQKLLATMPPMTFADGLAGRHIQSGEERGHAMPLIIMGSPRRYAGR
jgi:hypothetical protein